MEPAEAGAWVSGAESRGAQEELDLALLRQLPSLLQTEASLAGRGPWQPPALGTGSQRGIFCPVPCKRKVPSHRRQAAAGQHHPRSSGGLAPCWWLQGLGSHSSQARRRAPGVQGWLARGTHLVCKLCLP